MRITISHSDPDHPNAAPAAFRVGRIKDETDVVSGHVRTADELLQQLLAEAEIEFPTADGYIHTIERFVDHGDATAHFEPAEPAEPSTPEAG